MKGKKYIAVVLALVLVLMTVSTVSAKTERLDFTFHQICLDPENIERVIENGQGNTIIKHMTQTCITDYASTPEVNGSVTLDVNLNMVGNGIWKWTLKGYWVTDDGGVWETNCVYPWPKDIAHCEGKGEGIYAGYQMFLQTGEADGMGYGYITFNNP
jgi:hypothetical protein